MEVDSNIFPSDKGFVVHPPALQLVNLKTSSTLEKTNLNFGQPSLKLSMV